MKKYRLWVRLNPFQTTETIVSADNAIQAKLIGEHMFGIGSVLNYTELSCQ